ncbi:PAAR domain-containing protein [Pseudomonas putida]
MHRINMKGKGQALEGDRTTTGATCLASIGTYRVGGRPVLRQGDVTTPCPVCSKSGTILEGMPGFLIAGRLAVMDGARVACGCPDGCRVMAPLGELSPAKTATVATPAASVPTSHTSHPLPTRFSRQVGNVPAESKEPGFYVVPRSMTYQEVLVELGAPDANLPRSILQRLNPTYQQGFKAGEIFVIGDGLSRPVCTREELYAMSAAKQAREALAELTKEEANFMMRHQPEIAGLLSDASLAMGVSQAMMAKSLEELGTTLRNIEALHQQQFSKYGHLRSEEFFAERKQLFKQLDAKLRTSFLNKRMDLGSYDQLRRDLGISSKSLVHHWSKAGAPGPIPGYATHLNDLASMSKYLKAGGYVGVALGGASSLLKVKEACRVGETAACKKIRVTEAGNFTGGLVGGATGGYAGGKLAIFACVRFGPVGAAVCGAAVVGAGSLGGSIIGMPSGEALGEIIYEATQP